uniref:Uncharacterized protein n=1 Tax=Setaria digitata TaxID=48799 RepID=A0A915PHM2_9BILA
MLHLYIESESMKASTLLVLGRPLFHNATRCTESRVVHFITWLLRTSTQPESGTFQVSGNDFPLVREVLEEKLGECSDEMITSGSVPTSSCLVTCRNFFRHLRISSALVLDRYCYRHRRTTNTSHGHARRERLD